MPKAPYTLREPAEQTTSVVFASPHSGRDYPWAFLRKSMLDERVIRSSEDAFVDLLSTIWSKASDFSRKNIQTCAEGAHEPLNPLTLVGGGSVFDSAPEFGAPLLTATAPRAFIDLNRSSEELDPALIEGVRKSSHNPRVTSGLGVIPRVVANGRTIYRGKLTLGEARDRLRDFWQPYHDRLQKMLDDTRAVHGEVILIDCHSMPHEATDSVSGHGVEHPQIVLGDRFGAAADQRIVDRVEAAFASAGLRVARNSPFAGAYTTQHYGRPSKGQHVIQVEIDRSLYMNERLVRPSGNFPGFQALIKGVMAEIIEIGRKEQTLAAE